jgi:EAL domain-containing protein (putative c-di-GMP-specific phosphodiesterase class I)
MPADERREDDDVTAAIRMTPQIPRPRSASRAGRRDDLMQIVSGTRPVRMVFQPIVDIQTGTAVGYEALARFATRLTTSPSPWFHAAAGTPHAAPLEAVLIREALHARADLPAGTFVAVNVTPALLPDPDVLRAFGTGGDLSDVVIELTEHAPVLNDKALREAVAVLRQRGARMALDDVGVGWAGLKQVMDLRPEIVKLDHALVTEAQTDPVRQAIARMMLDLCSRLGLDLLVEGVETYAELDLFAGMGVPLAQGWVFGRPTTTTERFVDDDLAVRLKFRAGLTRHPNKIAPYVDMFAGVVRVSDDSAPGVGVETSPELPASRHTVIVDGAGRPKALMVLERDGREQAHAVMTVTATEDIASVAQRAMTRPLWDRLLPLVCVDRSGCYIGVVPMEALLLALAGSCEAPQEVRLP